MITRPFQFLRRCVLFAAVALATVLASPFAFGDKVHLKDGRVLEGTIVRQGEGFLFLKVKIGSLEQEQLITNDQISQIERDTPPAKTDDAKAGEEAKPADATPSDSQGSAQARKLEKFNPTTKDLKGATRVAILNFGPPSSWQGAVESTVGIEISAEAFKRVIPILEKDKVDVVVIRVNSGGGALNEMVRFQEIFQQEYKPKFRTVAWIESAISAAAMSPWVLEEFYFYPEGSMGACTGWYGRLTAIKGAQLEQVLALMEKASDYGKRNRAIMRAMQIQEPLSVDVDAAGNVTWRQDAFGQVVLNPKGQVFTINSREAIKYKFALGLAATKEELAKAIGLTEVEWVGQDATDYIDKNMRENDKANKRFNETYTKYIKAVGYAQQLPDKERRAAEIQLARKYLEEMRRALKLNPNYGGEHGTTEEWFEEQDDLLQKLAKKP